MKTDQTLLDTDRVILHTEGRLAESLTDLHLSGELLNRLGGVERKEGIQEQKLVRGQRRGLLEY